MADEHVLDVRGEGCPSPVVKVVRKLAGIPAGGKLKVITDIEECVRLIRETVEVLEFKVKVENIGRECWVLTIEVK